MFDDNSSLSTAATKTFSDVRSPWGDDTVAPKPTTLESNIPSPAEYQAQIDAWHEQIEANAPGFIRGLLSRANC